MASLADIQMFQEATNLILLMNTWSYPHVLSVLNKTPLKHSQNGSHLRDDGHNHDRSNWSDATPEAQVCIQELV